MISTIEMKQISLYYKQLKALDGITAEMEKGKTYGLIGRNGAGKTSLLALLASYRQPSSGVITADGVQPFEHAELMPEIQFLYSRDMSEETDTVKAALEDCARYRPSFDTDYAYELLGRFGLDETKVLSKLSTGAQAMLNVIEGLAGNASVTLFDEVHHGMDAPSRSLFYEALIESQQRHPRIIILSTHLVSEMARLFDHVIILHNGRIMIDEPYDQVVERGLTVTGESRKVEAMVKDLPVIDRKTLGGTTAAIVYGETSQDVIDRALHENLEISPVPLQELFIHLTKESNADVEVAG